MEVVARRGFGATMEEIADWCGVSQRTIFRHYACHDALIVATVKAMFETAGRRPIPGLAAPDEDFDAWLEGLAKTIHTRNAEILGDAFWDIHCPLREPGSGLRDVDELRCAYRRRGVDYLVRLAWKTAGGSGEPPEDLRLAFALEFSAFTTHALMIDFDRTPEQVGELTAKVLRMMLARAVRAQREQPPRAEDGDAQEP